MKTMEHWIRESVVEIMQNLRGSSLLAKVYTEGNGRKITREEGRCKVGSKQKQSGRKARSKKNKEEERIEAKRCLSPGRGFCIN